MIGMVNQIPRLDSAIEDFSSLNLCVCFSVMGENYCFREGFLGLRQSHHRLPITNSALNHLGFVLNPDGNAQVVFFFSHSDFKSNYGWLD